MRREGTKNYYYLDADTESMHQLLFMIRHAIGIMEEMRDSDVLRREEE